VEDAKGKEAAENIGKGRGGPEKAEPQREFVVLVKV
jgi:hypothetical protein